MHSPEPFGAVLSQSQPVRFPLTGVGSSNNSQLPGRRGLFILLGCDALGEGGRGPLGYGPPLIV